MTTVQSGADTPHRPDGRDGPAEHGEHGEHDEHHETPKERADRRWAELLQEVRVAQTGVQILLAFLLSAVFAPRFAELSETDLRLYVVTVVLGAGATAALIAPVTFHRLVTGRRLKPQAVVWASRLTMSGLCLLLGTVMCALLLVLRIVLGGSAAAWTVGGVLVWFVGCWFLLPAWARYSRDDAERPGPSGSRGSPA